MDKEARAVGVVERRLPGPHGVQQVAPPSPVRFVEQQENGWPQGARDARTQSGPHRGQGEAARPDLIEHSGPREGQQDSAEAWRMRPVACASSSISRGPSARRSGMPSRVAT